MSALPLAVIGIRILALYVIVQGVVSVAAQFGLQIIARQSLEGLGDPLQLVGLSAMPLLVGLAIWAGAQPLARMATSGSADGERLEAALDSGAIVTAVVIVIGLYLIAIAIPELLILVAEGVVRVSTYDAGLTGSDVIRLMTSDDGWVFRVFGELARLLVGFVLLFQRVGIRRLVGSLATERLS